MGHLKNLEKTLHGRKFLLNTEDCFRKENLKPASKILLQAKEERIFAEDAEGEISFFNYSDIARDHAFSHFEFC